MKVVPTLGPRKRPLAVCKGSTSAESVTFCGRAPFSLQRTSTTGPDAEQPADEPGSETASHGGRAIACDACRAAITSTGHRIAVKGSHDHRFMNPVGLLFHIACFAQAIGCTIVGPDSLEYPWFPGFAWRYAMCASCGRHLGWHFRAKGETSFFGLILDRLVEPELDA